MKLFNGRSISYQISNLPHINLPHHLKLSKSQLQQPCDCAWDLEIPLQAPAFNQTSNAKRSSATLPETPNPSRLCAQRERAKSCHSLSTYLALPESQKPKKWPGSNKHQALAVAPRPQQSLSSSVRNSSERSQWYVACPQTPHSGTLISRHN